MKVPWYKHFLKALGKRLIYFSKTKSILQNVIEVFILNPKSYQYLRISRSNSSVRREKFLSVIEALHWSDCQACRGAHFSIVEEDHETGSALCLAFSGWQGSWGIVPNGPASLHSGFFNTRQGFWSVSMYHRYRHKLLQKLFPHL